MKMVIVLMKSHLYICIEFLGDMATMIESMIGEIDMKTGDPKG